MVPLDSWSDLPLAELFRSYIFTSSLKKQYAVTAEMQSILYTVFNRPFTKQSMIDILFFKVYFLLVRYLFSRNI